MKKFTNFCGLFATVFVTTTIILLASCSQDDDYYENSDMYTLAEMGTRGGGNGGDPGGGGGDANHTLYKKEVTYNLLRFDMVNPPENVLDWEQSNVIVNIVYDEIAQNNLGRVEYVSHDFSNLTGMEVISSSVSPMLYNGMVSFSFQLQAIKTREINDSVHNDTFRTERITGKYPRADFK